jgi:hypothetical protein
MKFIIELLNKGGKYMAIIECSSLKKSLNFADGRLYAREAVWMLLQMLLATVKGGLYETPSLGFDKRDLLFYSFGSDEYELIKQEFEVMLKNILQTQDGIEIDYKRIDEESLSFNVTVADSLGNITKVGTIVNLSAKERRYKAIRVR